MIKVLVTGAFSTGKTETCKNLSSKLSKLPVTHKVLTDVGRECPLPLNKEQTFMSSAWLFLAQLSQESKYMFFKNEKQLDYIICDRGLPDILSHTALLKPKNDIELYLYHKMQELTYEWLLSFDYIFQSKSSEKYSIVSDGIREVDRIYQHNLEILHHKILKESGCNFLELPETIEDRSVFIMNAIKQ